MHMDKVWMALIESNETDILTQELLPLLFAAFSVVTQRLLVDHLPGGKYSNTDLVMAMLPLRVILLF